MSPIPVSYACIIDVTRCSVALADPADLMEAFQLLTSQESQDKLGYKIVRFKNIMVNALVRRMVLVVFCQSRRHPEGIVLFSLPKMEISSDVH